MTREEAELYALVHDGAPGDVAFYEEVTRGAGRVLELGCGWGRVARELEADEVIGLEDDEGMLALAEARPAPAHVRFIRGDMREFDLGTFDRIIVPFTGIYCLLGEEDLLSCLKSVARALEPDGRFIFDAYRADAFHAEAVPEDYSDDELELVAEIEHAGEALAVHERSTWNRDAQRMDATYVYLHEETLEERATLTIGHRYILSPQLEPLLERAGLRLDASYGGFDRSPAEASSGLMLVFARRA